MVEPPRIDPLPPMDPEVQALFEIYNRLTERDGADAPLYVEKKP